MSTESPIFIKNIPFIQNLQGEWIGAISNIFDLTVNLGSHRPSPTNEYVAKTITALQTPRGIEELVNSMQEGQK